MPLLMATLLAAAGGVEKNYREHKRTYKQKTKRESDYRVHFFRF